MIDNTIPTAMEILQDTLPITTIPLFIHRHLDHLLADEYVLMNKTVNLLLSLPIVPAKEVPEKLYDELKKNVKEITVFLKANHQPVNISINNFLEKTRLTPLPNTSGWYAGFQLLQHDHQYLINRISEVLHFLTSEDETYIFFEKILNRHEDINVNLYEFMQTYKKANQHSAV